MIAITHGLGCVALCYAMLVLSATVQAQTPACVKAPPSQDYNGYFQFSNIVIVDASVNQNHQQVLDSLFVTSIITNETSGSALWSDGQYEEWLAALNAQLGVLGAWDTAIKVDTEDFTSVFVEKDETISAFSIAAEYLINNASVQSNLQPLLFHAACELDMLKAESSISNWAAVTGGIHNEAYSLNSGSIWVVWQDAQKQIYAYFINMITVVQTGDCPDDMPWITCYQGDNSSTKYWFQSGTAMFNAAEFDEDVAQKVISGDANYKDQVANFWAPSC